MIKEIVINGYINETIKINSYINVDAGPFEDLLDALISRRTAILRVTL